MTAEAPTLYDTMAPCRCFHAFSEQETDFLKEYSHWFLTLNWKQGFLGRSMCILKAHKTDERDLTDEEVKEKFVIYCAWREAIEKAFGPDKINQAQLGNEEFLHKGHLHWHFIPRYRRPVQFADVAFQHDTEETAKMAPEKVHKGIIYPREVREKIRVELLKFLYFPLHSHILKNLRMAVSSPYASFEQIRRRMEKSAHARAVSGAP